MFGWGTFDRIQEVQKTMQPDPRKKEAEDLINKEGRGICFHCKDEIIKNEVLAVWESESLLAWCEKSKDHRHRPQIRWTSEGGVENVQ
jgi:hypothetical protein